MSSTDGHSRSPEFSFRSRKAALSRFRSESFDILIIGGGITGAATARDAAMRGLRVALVEKHDFAWGTSSRSSKLIHGGLRYLEQLEFGLVFEALAERTYLLADMPHMVRPLRFVFPVYKGDRVGGCLLSMGFWLYDLLALFRVPETHKRIPRAALLEEMPWLKHQGLKGGFSYGDAMMWDDVLVIENARAAAANGAALASYTEAVSPLRNENGITCGYTVRDRLTGDLIDVRATQLIVCGGPWTDEIGRTLTPNWHPWLKPSKGVHLVFSADRLPVKAAVVLNNPEDQRIIFVIPRDDMANGVVIVGTTDGPTDPNPEKAIVERSDVDYLLGTLARYFPDLNLGPADVISTYVGVRPLVDLAANAPPVGTDGQHAAITLQKVSREHHIDTGPTGELFVAGGKYTTARVMAAEIVETALKRWREDAAKNLRPPPPEVRDADTKTPVNPWSTAAAIREAKNAAAHKNLTVDESLWRRYAAEATTIVLGAHDDDTDPLAEAGFPHIEAQLRFSIRHEMVIHLEDFYLRRMPLFLALPDHGLSLAPRLARIWAEETGAPPEEADREHLRLVEELESREAWRNAYTLRSGTRPRTPTPQ